MYLAWKEIVFHKGRYILVASIVCLMAFMVFFLSSLSDGLAKQNRMAVENWRAESVVLSDYANENLLASTINRADVSSYLSQGERALVGQMTATAEKVGQDKKVNSQVFGVDFKGFLSPQVSAGRLPKSSKEILADLSIERKGIHLGDSIKVNGRGPYQVVGLTENQIFFTQPVLFMSLEDQAALRGKDAVSALVLRDQGTIEAEGLSQVSSKTVIEKIPGYQAQSLTFQFMIGAMVVVTVLVLAIFMYILVLQNMGLYGVMRAQGIGSGIIVRSVFAQIAILVAMGLLVALLLLVGVERLLPSSMPFYSDWGSYGKLSGLMFILSLSGGLLSVRRILRIDPLKAIGGDA